MRNLSDIIEYIIETRSNIRYFVTSIDNENPKNSEIDISYVSKNGECRETVFKDILFDVALEEMFQILRDNHFDVIDSDDDAISLYGTSFVVAVFTNILSIERIQYQSDDRYVLFLNNNFPNHGKKFYIEHRSYLSEILVSHGRYDLALML